MEIMERPMDSVFDEDFQNLIGSNSNLEEYGRFQQHTVLLEDEIRIAKYAKAILNQNPGGIVVDVGAGTGILSLLALKRGFDYAIMIEPSKKIASYAIHLATINGFKNKIKIINKKAEDVIESELPEKIDLIVTETLSSLIFGFGSWDALPKFLQKISKEGNIIPEKGKLYIALSQDEMTTRGSENGGIGLLNKLGLKIDLLDYTFRSGGNIYDKKIIRDLMDSGKLVFSELSHFNFKNNSPTIIHNEGAVNVPNAGFHRGIVLYWDVILSSNLEDVSFSSLDPLLTSWYPIYVPFINPILLNKEEEFIISMKLLEVDAPYKYAFQFWSGNRAITRILYW